MRKLLAFLLIVIVAPWQALAQPLADRVPGDALIYVGWQGVQHLPAEFQNSRAKALLDASGFPQFIDQLLPTLAKKVGEQDKDAAEAIKIFNTIAGPMWKHPSALYFSGVDFLNAGGPRPKGAIMCNAGADAPNLLEQVKGLLAQIPPGEVPFPINAFREGDLVVLAVGFDQNAQAIAGNDPNIKSLAASDRFKSASSKGVKEPVAIFYFDAEGAMTQIEQFIQLVGDPQAQQIWPKVKEVTGIGGLKRVMWTGGFADRDWVTKTFVAAPGPRVGLLKVLDGKPISDDLLRAIPKSANFAAAAHFDAGMLLNEIREIAGKIDPNAQKQFDQGLGAAQAALGFNPQKDLLEAVGPHWVVYTDPQTAGSGPLGLTIVNRANKPAELTKALDSLQLAIDNAANTELQREKMRLTFHSFKSGNATIRSAQVPLLAPSWTIADGNLYFALFPQMVVEANAQVAERKASLLDNPTFVAARKKLAPASGHNGFTFNDLPNNAGHAYQAGLAISQLGVGFADMFGVNTPPMVLPPLAKVKEHLSPAVSFSWSDDDGWHVASSEPFPAATLITAFGDPSSIATMAALLGGFTTARSHAAAEMHRAEVLRAAEAERAVAPKQ